MTHLSPTALEAAADKLRHAERGGSRLTPWALLPPAKKRLWCDKATAAITAYLAQMEKEGWVMVPIEPTDEMTQAAMNSLDTPFYADLEIAYRAMIANRPLAAAQNGGE